MKKRTLCTLFSILFLFSCAGENLSSSSSDLSSSSFSSKEAVEVKDFAEAVSNTSSSYALSLSFSGGDGGLFQIYDDACFYYSPNKGGYLAPETDPNYYHAVSFISDGGSISSFSLDVHGRNFPKKDKSSCFYISFTDILEEYASSFSLVSERKYVSSSSSIGGELTNYFQNRSYAYANYFEAEVDTDGRVSSFAFYEKDGSSLLKLGEALITPFSLSSFSPYQKWKEEGEKINLRIYDLKTGYMAAVKYLLCYQNKEVTISGVVSSFDNEGSYYISASDDETGYIGIKVVGKDGVKNPSTNDEVTVSGIIKSSGFVAYIADASYTKTGEAEYYPYFEEEAIASVYGGGYYAAMMFNGYPCYAGSIYSTYAYIASFPEKVEESENTLISIVFPTYKYSDGSFFKAGLILQKEMDVSSRESIIEGLEEFGIYGEEGAKEVSFERFIVSFSMYGEYMTNLIYGSESSFSKSLSPEEKVEKDYGLSSFPFPSSEEYSCYHFGGSTGISLEATYGISDSKRLGLYYSATSLSSESVEKWVNSLSSFGFKKEDVIKDGYRRKHEIYSYNDLFLDYYLGKSTLNGSISLDIWIYKGELIHAPLIKDIIKEKIPYFPVDDFLFADNTYSASYGYYALPNFAGHRFKSDEYLNCICIDMTSDGFSALRKRYIEEKGYKTYRNEDGSAYSYRSRGQNHYVLYKEIEGSEEKLFLDMASYPTSDYTFLNHKDFSTRIEMYIYKGSAPLSTLYSSSLKDFFLGYNEENGLSDLPDPSLPSDAKVEIIYPLSYETDQLWDYTYYGYFFQYECFLYTSKVAEAYEAIVAALLESGYKYYSTSQAGNDSYLNESGSDGTGSFILLMKKSGYIRILGDIGGIDF